MITVNTNGTSISAGFISALTADNTEYQARLLDGNTVLDCAITRITITKGSCGNAEAFTIGNVVGSTLVADVKGLATSVKGKELKAQIGIKVNGSFEYVNLGYFVVSETQQTAYATTLTAYGSTITRTGDAFTPPATQTLANIASAISTSASALAGRTVNVTFGTGITTSDTITASLVNLTCYQALQILTSCVGGYAIDTYDGNIKICRFDDTATLARTTATMRNLPVVDEQNFEVTGVLCIVTEASEDEEGQVVPAVQFPATPTGNENLVVGNPYMTQALYTSYLATLTGYEYRPATVGLTYGDPRLEGNDVVSVTDVNGNVYTVPCHLVTHKFDGGFTTEVVAVTATPQENEVATSAGNLTEQLSSISANTISARASAESAKASAESAEQSATEAYNLASQVEGLAQQAVADAQTASESAQQAVADAQTAYNSAQEAINSAQQAQEDAQTASSLAQQASEDADTAYNSAQQAIQDAQTAYEASLQATADAQTASASASTAVANASQALDSANEALASAQSANSSAVGALNSLSDIEKVVDALNWVSEHGEYGLTEDTTVQGGKWYFTRSGTSPNYTYAVVNNPTGNPSTQGWYELTSVDSAISNYISSHLALTSDGLSLQTDGTDTRLLLSANDGLLIKGLQGQTLAKYGQDTVIGDEGGFHIKIDGTEIGFYQSAQKVAYINGNKLYITQSVVLQQMDIGTPSNEEGGLGQWSWKVHPINGQNNLYLKWLG